ncbi:MAG: hypothetical protein WCV50_05705 [Patescibacteria group bacterium]|jgi:hypothetical protein
MFREQGSSLASGMDNMQRREDDTSHDNPGYDPLSEESLKAATSLSKKDNPLIAEQLDKLDIPFPTTLDEWRRVGEEVDQRTEKIREQIRLADEQHEKDRAPIREQRQKELQELQETLNRLRKQHDK